MAKAFMIHGFFCEPFAWSSAIVGVLDLNTLVERAVRIERSLDDFCLWVCGLQ